MSQTAPEPQQAEAPVENVMTVARDSRYARYLKMVQVVSPNFHLKIVGLNLSFHDTSCPSQGVPVMAIRNKMVAEGLDPNLLE